MILDLDYNLQTSELWVATGGSSVFYWVRVKKHASALLLFTHAGVETQGGTSPGQRRCIVETLGRPGCG